MKQVHQRSKEDIERIDALFREIGAGDFSPMPLREAREVLGQPVKHGEFEYSEACQKTIYPNKKAAQKVALSRQKKGAGKLRIYKCDVCHGFHLSSYISKI